MLAVELGDYGENTSIDATFTGAETVDFEDGPVFTQTLTGNVSSMTISNVPASGTAGWITFFLIQGSGPFTIAWPTGTLWPGAVEPTLSAGSGDIDVITLMTKDGGTSFYGFVGGFNFS